MYATASQEVRAADAALGDEVVSGAAAVVGGAVAAAASWGVVGVAISWEASPGGGNPLSLSVPVPNAPARPALA